MWPTREQRARARVYTATSQLVKHSYKSSSYLGVKVSLKRPEDCFQVLDRSLIVQVSHEQLGPHTAAVLLH